VPLQVCYAKTGQSAECKGFGLRGTLLSLTDPLTNTVPLTTAGATEIQMARLMDTVAVVCFKSATPKLLCKKLLYSGTGVSISVSTQNDVMVTLGGPVAVAMSAVKVSASAAASFMKKAVVCWGMGTRGKCRALTNQETAWSSTTQGYVAISNHGASTHLAFRFALNPFADQAQPMKVTSPWKHVKPSAAKWASAMALTLAPRAPLSHPPQTTEVFQRQAPATSNRLQAWY
jgi:hypothetical protein